MGANSFFIVVGDTALGNKIDQAFWFNSESGLDPSDQTIPNIKPHCSIYSLQEVIDILSFLVQNLYVTVGSSIHHQINGIPQGGHSSGFLANLTCHSHERKWVDKYPFHSLQYCISRYMDDFGVANADYFQQMYGDIYPEETGIRLVPNKVEQKPGHLVECKLLNTLIFVDTEGVVHVTLYDKREDYSFFVNRFPDIDSNACKFQSISSFNGEIVRLFRLDTHSNGFIKNVTDVASYLIKHKRYPEEELISAFSRFLNTQVFNPRLMGAKKYLMTIFQYKLDRKLGRWHKCLSPQDVSVPLSTLRSCGADLLSAANSWPPARVRAAAARAAADRGRACAGACCARAAPDASAHGRAPAGRPPAGRPGPSVHHAVQHQALGAPPPPAPMMQHQVAPTQVYGREHSYIPPPAAFRDFPPPAYREPPRQEYKEPPPPFRDPSPLVFGHGNGPPPPSRGTGTWNGATEWRWGEEWNMDGPPAWGRNQFREAAHELQPQGGWQNQGPQGGNQRGRGAGGRGGPIRSNPRDQTNRSSQAGPPFPPQQKPYERNKPTMRQSSMPYFTTVTGGEVHLCVQAAQDQCHVI
jgi:hypothetical protein